MPHIDYNALEDKSAFDSSREGAEPQSLGERRKDNNPRYTMFPRISYNDWHVPARKVINRLYGKQYLKEDYAEL